MPFYVYIRMFSMYCMDVDVINVQKPWRIISTSFTKEDVLSKLSKWTQYSACTTLLCVPSSCQCLCRSIVQSRSLHRRNILTALAVTVRQCLCRGVLQSQPSRAQQLNSSGRHGLSMFVSEPLAIPAFTGAALEQLWPSRAVTSDPMSDSIVAAAMIPFSLMFRSISIYYTKFRRVLLNK